MMLPLPSMTPAEDNRKPSYRAWALLILGLCVLAAVPGYVLLPALRAALHGITDPLAPLDYAIRAVEGWRVEVPLLVVGFALSIAGVRLERRANRASGAAATLALTIAILLLAVLAMGFMGVLVLGVVFVLLLA